MVTSQKQWIKIQETLATSSQGAGGEAARKQECCRENGGEQQGGPAAVPAAQALPRSLPGSSEPQG